MASIKISSFSMISVKDNDLLMPVLGSWVRNETGSVVVCCGSGMVKTPVNWSTSKRHISCLSLLKELVSRFIRGPMSVFQILNFRMLIAGRGCKMRPYGRGIQQSRSQDCHVGSHA